MKYPREISVKPSIKAQRGFFIKLYSLVFEDFGHRRDYSKICSPLFLHVVERLGTAKYPFEIVLLGCPVLYYLPMVKEKPPEIP